MKRLLTLLLLALPVFGQSTDAVLTGSVLDPAGASVPGASISALNVKTGVVTAVKSNNVGVYVFAALQPGDYRITTEMTGFRRLVTDGQTLHPADRVSLNLQLEVGSSTESVEVSVSADTVSTLTASVGSTVSAAKIDKLPVIDRNAMSLVTTQAGLVSTSSGANINGARADMTNVALDNVNIIDNFITEAINVNSIWTGVDRIEEVKVITSPADAEYGRGSGQVLLISRSGNNQFHGSIRDYTRNSFLNANTWANNRSGTLKSAFVENDVVGRLGGPIFKNKTFFFVLFEPHLYRTKATTTATVPTDTMRQGIYRFFPGATNANALAAAPTVDMAGNPLQPAKATGALQSVSLYGLDPNRLKADPTGFVKKYLDLLPSPNVFIAGDGLNTAGYRWRVPESDDIYSTNVRIDHMFNDRERLTVSYNHDAEDEPNFNVTPALPTSPGGDFKNTATVASAMLTSTPTATVVNVFTLGAQRALYEWIAPWQLQGMGILPVQNNVSYMLNMGSVTSPISTATTTDPQSRISPVYEIKDLIKWSHGIHQIKAGLERRYTSSNEYVSFNVIPRVNLGTASAAATQNISTISGIGANATSAGSLLSMLTGSVTSMTQYFNSPGGDNAQFVAGQQSRHTWRDAEWTTYFQDDIKLRPNLTINLGVRWEYYGVPYEAHGLIDGLVGGSGSIFGLSGTGFNSLFQPGTMTGSMTQFQLIGKGSPHADVNVWNPDHNNFAPAVGFAWGIPFLNANKTVLRAGYGIAYERSALVLLSQLYGYSQPGLSNAVTTSPSSYLQLANVTLPLKPSNTPLATIPLNDAISPQTVRAADSNLRSPYTQNWNIGIGRELAKGVMLDVRYVGSKGTKLLRGTNINEVNIFENGFLKAFQTTQAGGNAPLFTQFFNGYNVSGAGVVNGSTVTGSDAVRNNSSLQQYLINNDVAGLAYYFATTTNYSGQRGGLIKNAGLPSNFFQANPQFGAANYISNFSNSTYHSVQVEATKRYENGLSIQASYVFSKALGDYDGNQQSQNYSFMTLRNRHLDKRLLSFDVPSVLRTSGTWELPFGHSRKFLNGANPIVNKIVEHWETAVIFNKLVGTPTGFSAGATSSGYSPCDTFNYACYATPMALGAIPLKSIKVAQVGNNIVGLNGYTQVPDAAAQNMPTNLQNLNTMYAIKSPNGNLLLQNPSLGTLGNLNPTNIRGLGNFTFNLQVSKSFSVKERYQITLRADAQNLLNQPIWANPTLNINSTNFGLITSASGNRSIGLEARILF